MTRNTEAHWFESAGNDLFGLLHRTDAEEPHGTVLLLHGFTGSHLGPKYSFARLADALVGYGFDVFRFDYAGSGNSDGQFTDQHIDSTVRDTVNAADYLSDRVAMDAIGLCGHSMGGTTALLAADQMDAVQAVATSATPADYADTFSSTEEERIDEQDTIQLFGFEYPTEHLKRFFDLDLEGRAESLGVPLLVAHGQKDYTVPYSHAEQLYDAAAEPKQLLTLAESRHDLLDPDDRKELIDGTAAFMDEHL